MGAVTERREEEAKKWGGREGGWENAKGEENEDNPLEEVREANERRGRESHKEKKRWREERANTLVEEEEEEEEDNQKE